MVEKLIFWMFELFGFLPEPLALLAVFLLWVGFGCMFVAGLVRMKQQVFGWVGHDC